MNSKWKIAFAVCVFLLLGVTLLAVQSTRKAARSGREAAAARAEAVALRQQLQEPSGNQAVPATGMDPDVWRARVNRLQAQLEEKDRLIASLQKPGEPAPPPPPPGEFATNSPADGRPPWRDRGAWLEELKQTDPKRYEELQTRRQEARERRQRSMAEQANYFLNRDTAKMDGTELAEHTKLLELLDQTWRLSEQMQSDLPSEERHVLMETMRDNMQELTPLMDSERDRAFFQVGLDFGYTESEAQELTEYLNSVIEMTSVRTLFGGMHGGPGGGGPRDGGDRGGGGSGAPPP